MSLPLLDENSAAGIGASLREAGGFLWRLRPEEHASARVVIAAAHDLFERSTELKRELAIERSDHFRGWSEMRNERDWREQLHLGREAPAPDRPEPFARLEGPNLWPSDPAWRHAATSYMESTVALGERLLDAAVRDVAANTTWPTAADARYVVMKMIGYLPQPTRDDARPGVAPHVDFSWLTLTLQERGGLEVRRPDGSWTEVPAVEGTIWVHAGELLELATGRRYRATPHRVVHRSTTTRRVSVPLFLNPPLTAVIRPLLALADDRSTDHHEHVHRVLRLDRMTEPLHFGEAEWRRKGLNVWCAECVPDPEAALKA
ncbi:MAG: 2OG-Fe(II) oxygenase family protein [Kofleriaceae bacterium]